MYVSQVKCGREFEQTPGDSEGQGSLVFYSQWDHKHSFTTEQLQEESNKLVFTLSDSAES